MKYKKITKEFLLISLDRLTRFKLTKDKYERVFSDIINKFCIFEAGESHNLTADEKIKIVEKVINSSCENKENDLMAEIKADKALKALRNTDYYKNLDENDKYRKLWKYIVGTHGSKFSMSEDLEDICKTLAHEDDENF